MTSLETTNVGVSANRFHSPAGGDLRGRMAQSEGRPELLDRGPGPLLRTLTAALRQASRDGCKEPLQRGYRTTDLPAIRLRLRDLHEDLVSNRLGVCLILFVEPCSRQLAEYDSHGCGMASNPSATCSVRFTAVCCTVLLFQASCAPSAPPMITGP